jgi:hypothetical protein
MSNKETVAKSTQKEPASKKPAAEVESPAVSSEFISGNMSMDAQAVGVSNLHRAQRQAYLQRMSQQQGNRQAVRLARIIQQRHPSRREGKSLGNSIMRAELIPETTELATITADPAPMLRTGPEPGALLDPWGQLTTGDNVRILERTGPPVDMVRIHVERGDAAGRIGYVAETDLTVSAEPTSRRTPPTGTEDAYAQLRTELAKHHPSRDTLIEIINLRMTADQQQTLLQPGNAEYARLQATNAINADDLLNILNVFGADFRRKLSDYLDKGGNTVNALRQAFATANDAERLEVARDDALVGRLRPILLTVHPEMLFGTLISQLYPADGSVDTLRATRPELSTWLDQFATPTTNLVTSAQARATGLAGALTEINNTTPALARPTVLAALNQAPRGAALLDAERTALDSIEDSAYNEAIYSSDDLGVMFQIRWGRPFQQASSRPKTFLHRVYRALMAMPFDDTLLNNILAYFSIETNPDLGGSFTDNLANRPEFGQLLMARPSAETVHARGAQNGATIDILEPSLDLMNVGDQVVVTQADSTTANRTINTVNAPNRSLTFNQAVNVNDGAEIVPNALTAPGAAWRSGQALRVMADADIVADNAGVPDPGTVRATLVPGNLFSQTNPTIRSAGGRDYVQGSAFRGPANGTEGWIENDKVAPVTGGGTMGQLAFNWTVRHETGHSLDTQLNGFSNFCAPSEARWIRYTGVDAWLASLVSDAGIANPGASQTFPHLGFSMSFNQAARIFTVAIQRETTTSFQAMRAWRWLQAWQANGGSRDVYNVITQFDVEPAYFRMGNVGLPAIAGKIYAAHYVEWYCASASARTQSLALGVPPYAYANSYDFFADHYAAYTSPAGTGPFADQYSRAVPEWAQNYFDRVVGQPGAGPGVGMQR